MKSILFIFILFPLFLASQVRPDLVLTTGHNDQINAMTMSANSKFLASAGNNNIIKIWDVSTTKEYRTISGTNGRVTELDFTADGLILAGISSSDELYVWNVVTGEILHQVPASSSSKGLFISSNDKIVYYTNENTQFSYLNIESGETGSIPDVYTMAMVCAEKNGFGYILDHLGHLIKVDLNSFSKVKEYTLFDELNFPFSRSDISSDGKLIVFGFNDDKMRIFDTEEEKFVFESKKYSTKFVDLQFDVSEPHIYIGLHNGSTEIFNYKTGKVINEIPNEVFSVNCFAKDPRGGTVVIANMELIRFYDTKNNKFFKRLESHCEEIVNMTYDQQGKYLAVASDKINIDVWDLQKNKVVRNIKGFFPCQFTPDGKYIIAMNFMLNLGVFDVETGEQVSELKTDSELIQAISVSKDGKTVAGSGYMNIVKVWDFESKERIANLTGHSAGILALDFHPTEPWIASGGHDETVRVWDYKKKVEIEHFTDQKISISSVKFSPDGSELASASWDHTIYLRSTKDWSTKQVLNSHVNAVMSIDYSSDGKHLASVAGNNAVAEADNSLIFWETATGKKICQIKDHHAAINKVIFDQANDCAFTSSEDGTVKYNSMSKCGVVATFVAIDNEEFMVYTPDNYYMASKKALKSIAFRIEDKLVPLEQFDLYLNRPDIVTQRIGKSPDKIIKAYYYLYQKRLKRLNIEEGSLEMNFNLPKILNETLPEIVTNKDTQNFWIKAWDDETELKQLNVYVNDVPLYGESGFKVDKGIKSIRKEFSIPLIDGLNKVQFSCINTKGVESFYETVEIMKDASGVKNDLYVAAIGVSDYLNTAFNLAYPTKDVNDFVVKMRSSTGLYRDIQVKLLLNEDATTDNFQTLDGFFENCTHKDIAIIFMAGHGVLDEEYNYYYGTYDMDFNDPKTKGLPYDYIHKLLDKIKSYKKLLIMDTCHSGELDKDEIEAGPAPDVEQGNIEFRSGGAEIRTKEGFGNDYSVGYLKDVFSETNKGSGATVIASAGGAEYAMESSTWQNGLFTYCFLLGLETKGVDLNGNKMIEVSEIRAHVNKMVDELSGGKQKPSSREENISQDYAIFAIE